MLKEMKVRHNEAIVTEAAARFGLTQQVKNLGGFESFVYEYTKNEKSYILKLNHTLRRSEEYIMGELDWLNFLADNGVSVSRAVPSENGRLIERMDDGHGGAWLVMTYEKAPGRRATAEDWNGDLFCTWGRLIGKMHRLTQSYQLSNPAFKRQEWYEEEQLKARKYLPEHEAAMIARTDEFLAYIHTLPKPSDAYGVLHTDLHHGNFFLDDAGQITAFDFDDVGYNWFASDIAVCLIGALYFSPKPAEDPEAFAQYFLENFFRGYYEENHLDPKWLKHIRDFLMLRDLLLFIIMYQSYDPSTFNDKQRAELDEHRARVLEGRAPVELDWMQFVKK